MDDLPEPLEPINKTSLVSAGILSTVRFVNRLKFINCSFVTFMTQIWEIYGEHPNLVKNVLNRNFEDPEAHEEGASTLIKASKRDHALNMLYQAKEG